MVDDDFSPAPPSGILLSNQKRPDGKENEMTGEKERIVELFEELVPARGKADSVAGELVRAANRIGYRYSNDGDHVGSIDYGSETCNAAARYIQAHATPEISKMVDGLWDFAGLDSTYQMMVDQMCQAVADYVDENPQLLEEETEDMWTHTRPEDGDWGHEDEEDDWYGY